MLGRGSPGSRNTGENNGGKDGRDRRIRQWSHCPVLLKSLQQLRFASHPSITWICISLLLGRFGQPPEFLPNQFGAFDTCGNLVKSLQDSSIPHVNHENYQHRFSGSLGTVPGMALQHPAAVGRNTGLDREPGGTASRKLSLTRCPVWPPAHQFLHTWQKRQGCPARSRPRHSY